MRLGILATIGASMAYATEIYIVSRLVNVHAPGLVIASYEVLFGLVLFGAIRLRVLASYATERKVTIDGFRWALLAGVSLTVAIGAFFTALEHAPLSVVAPVGGIAPLIAYGLVLVLLRGVERVTRRTLAGAGLVVAGVALIGVYNT
jgi:drug/metabolite transporter (DMT)-like permease